MSEPYTVKFVLPHYRFSHVTVVEEIKYYIAMFQDVEDKEVRFSKLYVVPNTLEAYVSEWEIEFPSKHAYQLYKIKRPESYNMVSGIAAKYDEKMEQIMRNPDTNVVRVDLRQEYSHETPEARYEDVFRNL